MHPSARRQVLSWITIVAVLLAAVTTLSAGHQPALAAASCQVTYTPNSWNTGFTAEIKITNLTSTAIQGWTLTWSYANGQQVTSAWNATVTQAGANATASNPASYWNGTIAANGGTASFGVQGTHTGTNTTPTVFVLNGVTCGETAPDTQAPTVPTNLASPSQTSASINLSWTASTDNVGVTGYDIYRGSTLVGSSTTTSFVNTGLTASTLYTYTVRAKDAAGNISAASAALGVRTQVAADTQAPTVPTNLASPSQTTTSINLSWTASTDNVGVTGYDIYRGSTLVGSSTTTSFVNTGLTANTLYTYTVRAKDAAGNVSAASAALGVRTQSGADTQAPTVPTNLASPSQTTTSINLTWTASTDNVGVTGYDIYRGTTLAGSSPTASFVDTGLTADTLYSYTVRAKDAAGNVSAASTALGVRTQSGSSGSCAVTYTVVNQWGTGFQGDVKITNNTATAIAGWTLTWAYANGQQVTSAWNATVSQSGVNVTASNVASHWNGTIGANGGSVSFGFQGTHNGTNTNPTVFAVNGVTCGGSGPDTQAPTAPTNLASPSQTTTSINLSWTASTDNVGVTGYDIYRGGSLVGSSTTTSFVNTGLTANTLYTYTVRAKDAAGNVSAASAALGVRTLASTDTQAPTVPTNLASPAQSSSAITLTWTASTDNVGVTGYDIYRGGTLVGSSTTTTFVNTGLTASTAYVYTVRAKDAAGNVSAASAALTVSTLAGPSVPAVPTGLAGVAASFSVTLTWNASATATSYDVYRNGTLVASPTATGYVDQGLSASTTYTYTVRAKNAAGNSAQSAPISVTTLSCGSNCPQPHLDNPFVGATWYINPDWAASVNAEADLQGGTLGASMRQVAQYPTFVWLDTIDAVNGTNGYPRSLAGHLDAALAQGANLIGIVIYDLPNRDCSALASNGELLIATGGSARYKTEYVDVIHSVISQPKYAGLRIVAVIEPDSLPNLVTNLSFTKCQEANGPGGYVENTRYTLNKLHPIPNFYAYVDIGHAGWLGWTENFNNTVNLIADTILGTTAGGNSVDGFISNTANTSVIREPYMTANQMISGNPVRSADFFQWNQYIDEVTFDAAWKSAMAAKGIKNGMLIDTSRNGWGGCGGGPYVSQQCRPTGPSTSTVLNTFVNASRIDRRPSKGNWCNQNGAGIGERPQANPPNVDNVYQAFVWVKPPGESDGSSSLIPIGPDNPGGKGFDRMCDPTYEGNALNNNKNTNALPGAPVSGRWFSAQFVQLVQNAFPPIQ